MEAFLDILTDGSEYTGGPAIFLTLYKSIPSHQPKDITDIRERAILARYNLTGLPSLTGRLASDQSYQLLRAGSFRCVLLPSLDNCGGLAALFLSLVQYGYSVVNPSVKGLTSGSDSELSVEDAKPSMSYGDVSIIGPQNTSTLIDGILDVLFGNARRRPSIRVCEVPQSSEGHCWWDIYQDSYVRMWAQSVDNICICDKCSAGNKRKRPDDSLKMDQSVVYIVMIKPYLQSKGSVEIKTGSISFAILPHGVSNADYRCQKCGKKERCSNCIWNSFRNLPEEIIEATSAEQEKRRHHFDFILHLDPAVDMQFCNDTDDENFTTQSRINTDATKNDTYQVTEQLISVPSWVIESKISRCHLATFPDRRKSRHDPGVLIRAQQRSRLLNKYLPFAFPLTEDGVELIDAKHVNSGKEVASVDCFQLSSCSSVWINKCAAEKPDIKRTESCQLPFLFISRIEAIRNRSAADYRPNETFDPEVVSSLKCAFVCNSMSSITAATDDNEINLDDCLESDCDAHEIEYPSPMNSLETDDSCLDPKSPHLLLLGTGCATPSPLRGSSSYALFMPTSLNSNSKEPSQCCGNHLVLTAIIECGEGTLTSLSRHLPKSNGTDGMCLSLEEQLKWVQLIWISHSHLDHYGDLPHVVSSITMSRNDSKSACPLIIIAPSKVLKFLRVMLEPGGRHGVPSKVNSVKHPPYIGITHREFQSSPFASSIRSMLYEYTLPLPSSSQCKMKLTSCDVMMQYAKRANHSYCPIASIQNVEVQHCREAFALILELRVPPRDNNEGTETWILCFSGDTRPSNNLVRECRSSCPVISKPWPQNMLPPPPPKRVSLLIHEATFVHDENGKMDAAKKQHSTTYEALHVAEQMQVEACLLTHFSQRYRHMSITDACNDSTGSGSQTLMHNFSFHWGVGVDGMVIPLTKQATSKLNHLSLCVDKLVECHSTNST